MEIMNLDTESQKFSLNSEKNIYYIHLIIFNYIPFWLKIYFNSWMHFQKSSKFEKKFCSPNELIKKTK